MAKKVAKKRAAKPAGRTASKATRGQPARGAAKKKRAGGKEEDEAAMMAAWQASMTPSAGHKRLESIVGKWRTKTTLTMDPGAPPEVTTGRSEHRWVLGGRHVEQRYTGAMMGMPFEGLGYTGYDNAQGKYVGTWMDSFGTGVMSSIGVGRPKDDALDFDAQAYDPSGKPMNFRCKLRVKDRNRHSFEMWAHAPNGKLFRTMIVEYTRA